MEVIINCDFEEFKKLSNFLDVKNISINKFDNIKKSESRLKLILNWLNKYEEVKQFQLYKYCRRKGYYWKYRTFVRDISVLEKRGLTYSKFEENDEYWIGWDYAHLEDYYHIDKGLVDELGLNVGIKGKKWTVEEIETEIKEVINQLNEK